jgi:hypothetical protein
MFHRFVFSGRGGAAHAVFAPITIEVLSQRASSKNLIIHTYDENNTYLCNLTRLLVEVQSKRPSRDLMKHEKTYFESLNSGGARSKGAGALSLLMGITSRYTHPSHTSRAFAGPEKRVLRKPMARDAITSIFWDLTQNISNIQIQND